MMKRILIWDLSLRVFHTLFTFCLCAALGLAFLLDNDHPWFRLHMLFGLSAGFLLAIRLLLFFAGSRHARWRGMLFHPAETLRYLLGALTGQARRFAGHNPGTALIAWIMFGFVGLLVWSGLNMQNEAAEESHEALAFALLAAIGAHLVGLILHTVRHREWIGLSMLTGRKEAPTEEALAHPHRLAGLVTLVAATAWMGALFASLDQTPGFARLPLLGTTIDLGESETEEEDHQVEGQGEEHENDD